MADEVTDIFKEWKVSGKKKKSRKKNRRGQAQQADARGEAAQFDIPTTGPGGTAGPTAAAAPGGPGTGAGKLTATDSEPTLSGATSENASRDGPDEELADSLRRERTMPPSTGSAGLLASITDREVTVLSELAKVKREAMTLLGNRQSLASELKKQCDLSATLSEAQLGELRAEIKCFVSERKYDEELGRMARFTCDLPTMLQAVETFGEISHPSSSCGENPRRRSGSSASGHSAQFGSSDAGELAEDSRIKPPAVQPMLADTRINTPYQAPAEKLRYQHHFETKTYYNSDQRCRGNWHGHYHNGPQGPFYRHHGRWGHGEKAPDSKEHHCPQYWTSAGELHERPCPAAVGAAGSEGASALLAGRPPETTCGGRGDGDGEICSSRCKPNSQRVRRRHILARPHAQKVALESRLSNFYGSLC